VDGDQRLTHMGYGLGFGRYALLGQPPQIALEIRPQLQVEALLDEIDDARRGKAEGPFQRRLQRLRRDVGTKGFEQDAMADYLAVDDHAIAIADQQLGSWHAFPQGRIDRRARLEGERPIVWERPRGEANDRYRTRVLLQRAENRDQACSLASCSRKAGSSRTLSPSSLALASLDPAPGP